MTRRSVRASWRKLVVGLVAATSLAAPLAMPVVALATDANDIPVTFYPNNSQLNDQYYVTGGYSYSEGSAGFFRYIEATQAERIASGEDVVGSSATKYLESALADRSSTNSPFNLDSMKTSLDILKKCNELRKQDGLDELKVDTTQMAISQVTTAWASHYLDDAAVRKNPHAAWRDFANRNLSNAENLAWHYSVDGAFDGWYTEEKKEYENGNVGAAGHYLSIVNESYNYFGAGYCRAGSWNAYEQTFAIYARGDSYDLDEFIALFNEYYDMVKDDEPAAPSKEPQTITCASSFNKNLGDAPFYLNASTSGNGNLSYSSSNTSVATVSDGGLVTIKGPGTATITITAQETGEYSAATKTVTVKVANGRYVNLPTNLEHGKVSVSPDGPIAKDATVTINLLPDELYKVEAVSAVDAYGNPVPISGNGDTRTFVMPDADVTLSVSFIESTAQMRGVGFYRTAEPKNGTVIVEGGEFQAVGSTVTLVSVPDEGYELDSISAMNCITNEYLTLSGTGDTRTLVMPDADVAIFVSFAEAEEDDPAIFPDVSADDWYFGPVEWAVETGLMGGKADGTFAPGEKLSRAQLAVVLWNRAGNPSADPSAADAFVDTDPSGFYAGALNWCVENGYFMGLDSTHFSPSTSMTRESLAVVLWRMADYPESSYDLSRFPDGDRVSSYAGTAVRWAVENGIISGQGNGTLDPQGAIDRAQCAAIFQRLASK